MKLKYCNHINCDQLIPVDERYCPKHQPIPRQSSSTSKPFAKAKRSNEGLYNTTRWRNVRKKVLARDKHCYKCGSTEGLQVHHRIEGILSEEDFYNEDLLITVCRSCHNRITYDMVGRNRKRY